MYAGEGATRTTRDLGRALNAHVPGGRAFAGAGERKLGVNSSRAPGWGEAAALRFRGSGSKLTPAPRGKEQARVPPRPGQGAEPAATPEDGGGAGRPGTGEAARPPASLGRGRGRAWRPLARAGPRGAACGGADLRAAPAGPGPEPGPGRRSGRLRSRPGAPRGGGGAPPPATPRARPRRAPPTRRGGREGARARGPRREKAARGRQAHGSRPLHPPPPGPGGPAPSPSPQPGPARPPRGPGTPH